MPEVWSQRYKTNDCYVGNESHDRGNKNKRKKGGQKEAHNTTLQEDTPLGYEAKQRKILALVIWYLPVVDHLRQMFLNPKEAAMMTWWDDERKKDDDGIQHPVDAM